MSKAIKDMLVDDLKGRLTGVGDVIVVSLGKLDAQKTTQLRQSLRKKRISLQLVKNSLARRAMADTPLSPAFDQAEGMLAIAWGGEDVVDLAKELDRLQGVKDFEGFECRGGALDGARLSAGDVCTPGSAALSACVPRKVYPCRRREITADGARVQVRARRKGERIAC